MTETPPPTPPADSQTPPKAPPQAQSAGPSSDTSLIPFVTQAFNNLFTQLSDFQKELELLKASIEQISKIVQSRFETIEPRFQEILLHVREQRRSSVTHYSQLAATVAQGFESLGEIRTASADKQTADLLAETLHAAHDALYCLRMERLIKRYLDLEAQSKASPASKDHKGKKKGKSK